MLMETAKGAHVDALDALSLAMEAGSPKAVNIVLMGVLSKQMEFSVEDWKAAIAQSVKPAFVEMNEKAFDLGREA